MLSSSALAEPADQLHFPVIRRLPNGLTIVAEQMPVEAVNLSVWLRVGSAQESDDINGIAHFLEHMVFKGTPTLLTGEFERRIEERGAMTNAATSQDYTHFYLTAAPRDFSDLAPLQVQIVMNPRLTTEDFERERPVILEEIRRAEDNPRRRTFYRSMEMAFERLPYRRPVLGSTATVEGLTSEQMRTFHSCWYRPDHITAVVVGNLPVEELMGVVAESFEQVCGPAVQRPARMNEFSPWPACDLEPPFESIRKADFADLTLQQARLVMSWRVPGVADLAETYPLDVAASILARGRTSRLVRRLREEQGLVSSISASNMTYSQQGVFYIAAQMPVEHLDAVEAEIVGHMDALCNQLVTEAELHRVRTQVANRYIFASETPSDRAGLYGYYQTMTGDLRHSIDYPAKIQAVSPLQIQAAAQQYLNPYAYGLVTIRPS